MQAKDNIIKCKVQRKVNLSTSVSSPPIPKEPSIQSNPPANNLLCPGWPGRRPLGRAVLHAPPGAHPVRVPAAEPVADRRGRFLGGGLRHAGQHTRPVPAVRDAAGPTAARPGEPSQRRRNTDDRAVRRAVTGQSDRPRGAGSGFDHHDLQRQPAGTEPVDRHRRPGTGDNCRADRDQAKREAGPEAVLHRRPGLIQRWRGFAPRQASNGSLAVPMRSGRALWVP